MIPSTPANSLEQLSALVMAGQAFTVKTEPVQRVLLWLAKLVTDGGTGGTVIGLFRQGKTLAIRWALHSLSRFLDPDERYSIPWFFVPLRNPDLLGDKAASFFRYLLRQAKHEHYKDGRADDRRDAFVEMLTSRAQRSPFRCVILVFDEAHILRIEHLGWIHSVVNELEDLGMRLIVILIGNSGLEIRKNELIAAKRGEIAARWLIDPMQFSGLSSEEELRLCLDQFAAVRYPPNSALVFPQLYAPGACGSGFQLKSLAGGLWTRFDSRWQALGMGAHTEVPMKPFTAAVVLTLKAMNKSGGNTKPDPKMLDAAVDECGYVGLIGLHKASIASPRAAGLQ
jgi:type II secretory pathway predicted ATPase ExeA